MVQDHKTNEGITYWYMECPTCANTTFKIVSSGKYMHLECEICHRVSNRMSSYDLWEDAYNNE